MLSGELRTISIGSEPPLSDSVLKLLEQADTHLVEEQYSKASSCIEQALDEEPKSGLIFSKLLYIRRLRLKGDLFLGLRERYPENPLVLLEHVREHLSERNVEESKRSLESFLSSKIELTAPLAWHVLCLSSFIAIQSRDIEALEFNISEFKRLISSYKLPSVNLKLLQRQLKILRGEAPEKKARRKTPGVKKKGREVKIWEELCQRHPLGDYRVWKLLYQRLQQFSDLKPWSIVGHEKPLGFCSDFSSEPMYIVLTGTYGQSFAMNLYLAEKDLTEFYELTEKQHFDPSQLDLLQIALEYPSDCSDLDRDLARLFRFNGERIPSCLSYLKGYAPWTIQETEAALMSQAIDVVISACLTESILDDWRNVDNDILILEKEVGDSSTPSDQAPMLFRALQAERSPRKHDFAPRIPEEAFKAKRRSTVSLEVGQWSLPLVIPYSEPYERPVFQSITVGVVSGYDEIFGVHFRSSAAEHPAEAYLACVLARVSEGALPWTVLLRERELVPVLADALAPLNIEVRFQESLRSYDRKSQDVLELVMRGLSPV